jgi:phosphoglucosamine mutase
LGRAAGLVLFDGQRGEVVVGRDTRISGPMLEDALIAGLCSAGVDVLEAGVVPTPAVAYLTVERKAGAGAMVSASHNPVPDNGIKFFSEAGMKIDAETEAAIERVMAEPLRALPEGAAVGTSIPFGDEVAGYAEHLVASIDGRLEGLKVVLDCAFGSAWSIGPEVFRAAGAEVVAIHGEPDGARINVDCGSTSLRKLAARVVDEGAALGFAFDGDADRVLACDETGATVDGDHLLALSAIRLHDNSRLHNDIVVATVMANLGFKRALEERGIEVVQAPVGDKYVMEAMVQREAVLGGEQSGHLIFAEHATTGDGILAALQVAAAARASGEPFSRLAHVFESVPQVLININVTVAGRAGFESSEALWDEVRLAEESLGADGRVLLRASGTEPVVRVMVEALDAKVAEQTANRLAEVVRTELGSPSG